MGNDKPISNISFTNRETGGHDRPSAEVRRSSLSPDYTRARAQEDYDIRLNRNELKAMLGRQLDDIRPGSQLNIYAHADDGGQQARMRMYQPGY